MHPLTNDFFGVHGMKIKYSLDGATTVDGHIVRQTATSRYIVAPGAIDAAHKSTYVKVRLARTPAEVAALPAHVGTITVTPFGGGPVQHARKLLYRKLFTVEGHSFNWRKTAANEAGECNVAGDW